MAAYTTRPFALSLSKGMSRRLGFDKLSPNGVGVSLIAEIARG